MFKPVTPKRNCRPNHVADFLNEHGAWNTQLLRKHFWPMDVDEILKIRTSPRQRQGFVAWQPERVGHFTVHSAYKLATTEHDDVFAGGASSGSPNGERQLWKKIWSAMVPQKMKIVAWKASMHGRACHHEGQGRPPHERSCDVSHMWDRRGVQFPCSSDMRSRPGSLELHAWLMAVATEGAPSPYKQRLAPNDPC